MNSPMLTTMRSRAGLTLVEIVVSLLILTIGISVLFDSMMTSRRVNDRATNQAKAYEEIQAQIESIQYMPFDSIQKGFKGISFNVRGLRPPQGAVSCGTVTRLSNPNPDDTSMSPNPNAFLSTDVVLPLRFRVAWEDEEGPAFVETVYVVVNRGEK